MAYEIVSITAVPSNRIVNAIFDNGDLDDIEINVEPVLFYGECINEDGRPEPYTFFSPLYSKHLTIPGRYPIEDSDGYLGLDYDASPDLDKWKKEAKRVLEREKVIAVKKKFKVN